MNGDRYKFGPIGPRERVAEQLIVAAGLGDYDAISTILRHDLAHVDVSDKCGLTALQAAAVCNGLHSLMIPDCISSLQKRDVFFFSLTPNFMINS